MVRLTKIYTRTGDKGTTRLVGGQEVSKGSLRITSYGTVDELNSVVGLIQVEVNRSSALSDAVKGELSQWLYGVQQRLFDAGSDLATYVEDRHPSQPIIHPKHASELETDIDRWNDTLEPLNSFVLPGGGAVSATMHLARTVCRRAERLCVALSGKETVNVDVLIYLNRLSDAFFVLSRWVAKEAGVEETLWQK
jgi:cob(I)alamin adenosyltransferase